MYEPLHGAKHLLRGGTALLLALLLCGAVGAGAADMTDTRMLVPVGHTVGIKLFSPGRAGREAVGGRNARESQRTADR